MLGTKHERAPSFSYLAGDEAVFMSKKTQKKRENYVTTFNTLKSGFICRCKKNLFEDWVSEIQFKAEYLCLLQDLKRCLE